MVIRSHRHAHRTSSSPVFDLRRGTIAAWLGRAFVKEWVGASYRGKGMARLCGYQLRETLLEGVETNWFRAIREADQVPVLLKSFALGRPPRLVLDQWRHEYALLKDLRIDGVLRPVELHVDATCCALVFEHFTGEFLKRNERLSTLPLPMVLSAAIRWGSRRG